MTKRTTSAERKRAAFLADRTEIGPLTCSICQGEIEAQGTWLGGHNAQPINNGRCCTDCNNTVVIPVRLVLIMRADREVK
jgi:hypothetical protein